MLHNTTEIPIGGRAPRHPARGRGDKVSLVAAYGYYGGYGTYARDNY